MNIEKNGFYSPNSYEKVLNSIKKKSPKKRKIDLFKIDCPSGIGSATNLS